MVADLSGSTALGERLDPEDLRLVVGGFFRSLTHEIHRFGGTIDKYVGDAIRANFAGTTGDDSAVRGLRAGLAMLEALATRNEDLDRKYGVRLKLRIGVNTGEVIWSGPTGKAEPTVGRTVSIAQRLESTAAPNTVHAGDSTYRAARRKFEFKAAPLITITGADDLERAYELVGAKRGVGAGSERLEVPVAAGGASLQVGAERAYLLEEQRKVVTVLFADLAEPLADRLQTEVLQRVLGSYFSAVSAEIARFKPSAPRSTSTSATRSWPSSARPFPTRTMPRARSTRRSGSTRRFAKRATRSSGDSACDSSPTSA